MENQEGVVSHVAAAEDIVALQIEDSLDSRGWASLVNESNKRKTAKMPVERDAHEYNMKHKYRGKAVIFNHEKFTVDGLPSRKGTEVDRDRLSVTLKQLEFDVEIYEDLTLEKVMAKINDLAQDDHSERDCLLIAAFSHGIPGKMYAMDGPYKKELLWDPFTADRCLSLAGKPKIFLLQACQGEGLDTGTVLRLPSDYSDTDCGFNSNSYTIPNRADFLMAFSTVPGYYSWRNRNTGSWFIQSICEVFMQHFARKDLVTLLTMASRIVAIRYESFVPNSQLHQMKQMPLITSTLLREVYFMPKCEYLCLDSVNADTVTETEPVHFAQIENQENLESQSEVAIAMNALQIEDGPDTAQLISQVPLERNIRGYNMKHRCRGKAIIFNHKKFTDVDLDPRKGSDRDRDGLSNTLKNMDFDVEIYEDLKLEKVIDKIYDLAHDDHSERDCLLIAVFSHGTPERIYAMDGSYKKELLWDHFTADRCPSLAGKPKIFLIQACQGEELDAGTTFRSNSSYSETDSLPATGSYVIPNRADFLMAFSTFPGYYSWRETTGSWFIQSICDVFSQHSGGKDLIALLTMASRIVAIDWESCRPERYMHQKKQMPLITSTLLWEVYFKPKYEDKCVGSITTMTDATTESVSERSEPFFGLSRRRRMTI